MASVAAVVVGSAIVIGAAAAAPAGDSGTRTPSQARDTHTCTTTWTGVGKVLAEAAYHQVAAGVSSADVYNWPDAPITRPPCEGRNPILLGWKLILHGTAVSYTDSGSGTTADPNAFGGAPEVVSAIFAGPNIGQCMGMGLCVFVTCSQPGYFGGTGKILVTPEIIWTVTVDLSSTPVTPVTPTPAVSAPATPLASEVVTPTAPLKSGKAKASAVFGGIGGVATTVAGTAAIIALTAAPVPGVDLVATPVAGLVAACATIVAGVVWTIGSVLSYIDPPDPHYKSIVRIVPLHIPPLKPQRELTPAIVAAVNGLAANSALTVELERAFLYSLEKAQGAAHAGAKSWVKKQALAAAGYAARLADALARERTLFAASDQALSQAHFPNLTFTPQAFRNYQQVVAKHGLPSSLVSTLKRLGLGSSDIAKVRSMVLNASASSVPRSFLALFHDPALAPSLAALSVQFARYATRVRAAY